MVVYLSDLGVNVFSIIIGAMFFIIAIAWIDTISALSEYIYIDNDDEQLRYQHHYYKKLVNALYVTAFGLLVIILLYTFYKCNYHGHAKDNQS